MTQPDYQAFATAVGDPLGDMARNTQSLATMDQINANRTAGRQIASGGSYADAAKTLFGAGDLAGGQKAIGVGGQMGEASALAKRDYSGAATAAAAGGDKQGVIDAQTQALQQFQLRHAYLQRATPVLNAAFQKFGADGIAHAFDTLAPDLQDPAIGFTPDQIAQFKKAALSDPQGFLANINAFAQRKIAYQKVGDNTILPVFEDNGQPAAPPITGETNTPLPAGDSILHRDATGAAAPGGVAPQAANGRYPSIQSAISAVTNPAVDKPALTRLATIESGGDPNAQNPSGASGMFQFMPKTAHGFGLTDPTDPAAAAQAAGEYQVQAAKTLTPILGRQPTGAELYLAHQQGPAGAAALLQSPDTNAIEALTPLYGSAAKAKAAITQNGGTPDMTAKQFVGMWQQKYDAASPSPLAGATSTPIAPGVAIIKPEGSANREATPQENAQYNPGGTGQIDAKGQYHAINKAGDINNWTPEAVDTAADQYRKTGILPATRGQGGEAAEQSIINRAAEMDKQEGISPAAGVARRALVSGTIKAQSDLIDTISKMQSYERNANRDFDNVSTLAQQALSSGKVKTLREIAQWIKTQKGDVALGKFNTALVDAKGNYAKIVLGSGTGQGGAPGTGPERADLDKLFDDDLPVETILGNIQQARVGMANRMDEQTHQYQINDDIIKTGKFDPDAGKYTPPATPASPAAGGKVIIYGPDGKRLQ